MRPDEFLKLFFEQLQQLAPNATAMTDEMQQHLKSTLMATLSKLDLVTRDEFDAQQAVLARTREKLEALQAEVEALEKNLTEQS